MKMRKFILIPLLSVILGGFVFSSSYESASPYSRKQITSTQTEIVIKTNVSNVDIYINKNYQGKSDLTITSLEPGYYSVELRKEGYETGRYRIQVKRGYSLTYKFNLQKKEGYLKLFDLSDDSIVYVDGNKKTSNPITLDLGSHTVKVRRFGYKDYETKFYIENRVTTEIRVPYYVAPFKAYDFSLSRKAINPNYSNSLGKCEIQFEVTNHGRADIYVADTYGNIVWSDEIVAFYTWEQSAVWNGRDSDGEFLGDGEYTVSVYVENYVFEDTVRIDRTVTYPVVSYTNSGLGIGNVPIAASVSKDFFMPFISTEVILRPGDEESVFYGVPVTVGFGSSLDDAFEFGFCAGGIIGQKIPENSSPFFINTNFKAALKIPVGDNNINLAGLFRYGYNWGPLYGPKAVDAGMGLGLGGIFAFENKDFYAGLSTEYIFGADSGNVEKGAQVWKNGIALSYKPVQFMRWGTWAALHSVINENMVQAVDTGVEFVVVPELKAFSLNGKVKALIYTQDLPYISGEIGLSYLF